MAKANEFLRALQAQQGGVENVGDYWPRRHATWLEDLRALRARIRDWMRPIEEARFATVADIDFATNEPDVGYYMAPGLELRVLVGEPRQVAIHPRGLQVGGVVESGGARILGAMGRVDFECGATREILLRFRQGDTTTWASFSGGARRDLDEDLFFELLARTTGVALR
jgi:hypothetical protein